MIYNNEKVYDIEQLINSLEIGMRMPVQLKRKDGVILVEKDRIITERIIDHLIRIKSQIEHIQLDDMDSKDADDLLNIGRKPKETVNVESIKEVEEGLNKLSNNFNVSNVQDIKGSMKEIVNSIKKSTECRN